MCKVLAHDAPVKCDGFVCFRRCLELLIPLQSPRGDLQNKFKFRNALACFGELLFSHNVIF